MLPSDLARGLVLCRACGWNQVTADWEQLLGLGGAGCLVAEVDGTVAGTLTKVTYEQRFAWIGMVLVDPALRGRGIATALMRRAIDAAGDVETRLDATPQGEPLYARLGFVEESRLVRMTREAAGDSPAGARQTARRAPGARPMEDRDLDEVLARDLGAFGAGRADLLRWALRQAPGLARVVEGESGGLRGYCFGRPGHRWWQVGPVAADGLDAAEALVTACVGASGDAPLVIDAAGGIAGWDERLTALGFVGQRPFIRMCRGAANRRPAGPDRQLAIFGPEWG
jgi:GNAT superfamily N-acetyltransferase